MKELDSDALLEVFEFLYGKDLENAAEVCKSWNDLIASSSKLVKRLCSAQIDGSDVASVNNAVKKFKRRPYRKLFIAHPQHFKSSRMNKMNKIFKARGHHIDNLEVCAYKMHKLMLLLPCFSNLTRLDLFNISTSDKCTSNVDLYNLKDLRLYESSQFIKHLGSHQIQELTWCDSKDPSMEGVEEWKEFLITCPNLETLTIKDFWCNLVLSSDMHLRLTKLAVENCFIPVTELLYFLAFQIETLRVLDMLDCRISWRFALLDFVLFGLQLEEFSCSSTISGAINDEAVNTSIKKLNIQIGTLLRDSFDCYCKVITSLQAVEHLEIKMHPRTEDEDQVAVEIIRHLTVSMPKLKFLKLEFEEGLRSRGLYILNKTPRIEQVETLETNICTFESTFESDRESALLIFCPNVKKLISKWVKISAEHFEIMLQALKEVEEIHTVEIDFNEKLVDLILNSKIRRIELEKMPELPEKLKHSKILIFQQDLRY